LGAADIQRSHRLEKFLVKSATNKESEPTNADNLKGKTVGIYFSAHWCGPCRGFTPELIKTYEILVADRKPFEIIFVSSDRDETAFKEYYGTMPWMAVPFDDEPRREALNSMFEVEGIPTLVIVDYDTGKVITKEGRSAVGMDAKGAAFPWNPKPINELTRSAAGTLNDTAALIVFLGDVAGDDEKKVIGALEPLAKEVLAGNSEDLSFFVGKKDTIVSRVRDLFGSAGSGEGATWMMGILDIPKGSVFVADKMKQSTDITDASVRAFYKDYKDGKLKATPISAN